MQFSVTAVVAALVATAAAYSNSSSAEYWVTETVTELTTVCPVATTLTHNGHTYTATASQTITITNCPCTVSHKVTVAPVTTCVTVAPSKNATVPTTTKSTAPVFTGAANNLLAGSAAGLAGVLGVVALVL